MTWGWISRILRRNPAIWAPQPPRRAIIVDEEKRTYFTATMPDDLEPPSPPPLPDASAATDTPEQRLQVTSLVGDLRAHRELLEQQARELTRLEGEVLVAAAQESREIVTAATVEVRRILRNARRELLVLAAQVQEVTGRQLGDLDTSAFSPPRRGVVRHVIDATRPEIDALQAEASALRASLASPASASAAPEPETVPVDAAPDSEFDLEPVLLPSPTYERRPPSLPGPTIFVAAFAAICVVLLTASWWWLGRKATADGRSAPQASVPAAAAPGGTARVAGAIPKAPSESPAPWLAIEARRRVWLRVRVDGAPDPGSIIEAGTRREIASGTNVVIRVGDAGAILISEYGAEPKPLGSDGRALTRSFSQAATTQAIQASPDPPTVRQLESHPQNGSGNTPESTPTGQSPAASLSDGEKVQDRRTVSAVESPGAREATPPSAEIQITEAAARWMSGYFVQDTAVMRAAAGGAFTLSDERAPADKAPTAPDTRRVLDQVKVLVVGNDAVYTARLRETMTKSESRGEFVSLVSIICERVNGNWHLASVQITPEAAVRGTLRQSLSGP
jgi:hypothetical protein